MALLIIRTPPILSGGLHGNRGKCDVLRNQRRYPLQRLWRWLRRYWLRIAIALKSNEPYAFAGLLERWKDKQTGGELLTFTIITKIRMKSSNRCTTECR
jgi:hypothetical protein